MPMNTKLIVKCGNKPLIISFLFFINGCSTVAIDDPVFSKSGLPVHGHFCGPNVPLIKDQNPNNQIKMLLDIEPIDYMDKLCLDHDICYVENKNNTSLCDKNLLDKLAEMKDPKNRGCLFVKKSIESYFKSSSPSYVYNVNKEKSPIHEAFSPVENILDVAELSLTAIGSSVYMLKENLEEKPFLTVNTGDSGKKRFDPCY